MFFIICIWYVLFKRYLLGINGVQFIFEGEDLIFRGESNEYNIINKCQRMNLKFVRKISWCFY